jgi:hypothetical protein
MKNFIEVTGNKGKLLINIGQIAIVRRFDTGSGYDSDTSCEIGVFLTPDTNSLFHRVSENYDQIKELIEQASK